MRVTSNGVRSFILEKRIDGRVKRQTIGRYGELTVEQARKEATKLLGQIATSINPIAERERHRLAATTLDDAFQAFVKARSELLLCDFNDQTLRRAMRQHAISRC